MGNFGQVPNYFRGILLWGNLFVTAVPTNESSFLLWRKRFRGLARTFRMETCLLKSLELTSLHSLPLGIVLHPFCGCLVGLHTIQCHWQDLHWQSGGQNWHWQPVDQEWHQTVIQYHSLHHHLYLYLYLSTKGDIRQSYKHRQDRWLHHHLNNKNSRAFTEITKVTKRNKDISVKSKL